MSAHLILTEVLAACLPPGVPSNVAEVRSVSCEGRGRARVIRGELTMLDGVAATVELRPWAHGWSHRFVDMPGGALSWEGGRWVRVPDADPDLFAADGAPSETGEAGE